MTSRAHLEIFNENYYPTVFSNWFLDDWIGSIYGENASVRLHDFHVLHHELDDVLSSVVSTLATSIARTLRSNP